MKEDKLARFRRASAARRMGAGVQYAQQRFGLDGAIARAKAADLPAALEARGWRVRRDGVRHRVAERGGVRIRMTWRDGSWLWCHWDGAGGGDAIDAMRQLEGLSMHDAVAALVGGPVTPADVVVAAAADSGAPLVLPPCTAADRLAGRRYLRGRGISDTTLDRAEACGALAYSGETVLFVGRDHLGRPRWVSVRSTVSADKRLLRGSDARFPLVLPAAGGDEAWVVEGGVDALAVHEIALRRGDPAPLVVATGGVGVMRYLEGPALAGLRAAQRVWLAGEWEASPEVQARTDALRARHLERLREALGHGRVALWWPPEGVKDIAELNARARDQQEPEMEHERLSVGVADRPTG